jgi:hypothetical protein
MKRREMIRSLAIAAAIGPVAASAKEPASFEQCQTKAAKIAGLMGELFGGEWRVSLQQDFVMISKKIG